MKGSPQTPVHNREHAPAEHHKQAHHKQEQRDQQPHQQPPQRRKHHRLLLALLLSAGLHLLLLWPQARSPGPQPPVINARLQLPEPVIPQLTARPASQPLPQPAEQLPSTKPAATQDSTRGVSAAANQHKSAGAQPGSGTAAEETTTPASDNRAESADRQPSPGKTEAMEQALAADPQERPLPWWSSLTLVTRCAGMQTSNTSMVPASVSWLGKASNVAPSVLRHSGESLRRAGSCLGRITTT